MLVIAKKKENPVEPISVNSVQACKLLGVSATTLTKWTRENKIPHRRINRRILYSVEALKAFVAGKEIGLDAKTDISDYSDEKTAE